MELQKDRAQFRRDIDEAVVLFGLRRSFDRTPHGTLHLYLLAAAVPLFPPQATSLAWPYSGVGADRDSRAFQQHVALGAANETKTRVCKLPEEKFDFLGYTFGRCYSPMTGRAYRGTVPSKKRVIRICETISEMTGRDQTLLDQEMVVAKLNRTIIGWANCFCKPIERIQIFKEHQRTIATVLIFFVAGLLSRCASHPIW
jgi:Group II intron, maturase-specific domain